MSRLLIVANRLPITVTQVGEDLRVERSAGGLATGMSGLQARGDTIWVGWPGDVKDLSEEQSAALDERLEQLRAHPVWLDPEEVKQFYEGFSNSVLWPLFHHLLGTIPLHVDHWEVYQRANARFTEETCRHYQDGDWIWVHDYQLMLVPRMLRERLPGARIGFFLHIPFPASEIFRTLPYREELLEGLLGADLVGFHTAGYMRSFSSSLLRVLGVASRIDRVTFGQRQVKLGVFPMGVDSEKFAKLSTRPEVESRVREIRGGGECAILLGVDRLDYTKGIRRRLLALEALLKNHPELREKIRLIQVAVPSRINVEAYQDFRHEVDALIGRINGAFGTPGWAPIHYIYRSVDETELVALYCAADVMLVTPLRDGMNLVAKEFVASRTDEGGVLVLSEFAGAASELAEAVIVNPFDIDRTAEVFYRALELPDEERLARMQGLRRRVLSYDVHYWVRSFLESLDQATPEELSALAPSPPRSVEGVVQRMRAAPQLLLLLGYDGTLVPFASAPELSVPDDNLVALLRGLAANSRIELHLVSGSSRQVMEKRFANLPLHLHAEYGFWSRRPGAAEWSGSEMPPLGWHEQVRPILESFTGRTPGSLIEDKTTSIAWHYRMAEPEFGAFQANELTIHLQHLLSNAPVEILTEDKIVEVRAIGVNKGIVVPDLVGRLRKGGLVVAMGDGRTDEELFAALPKGAIAIHVGLAPSRAELRLRDFEAARELLAGLL